MAEFLYVCEFSNGHIKVGRSVDPQARIASHADRVSCMGVELVRHFVTSECVAPSHNESALIERCVEAAESRFLNEWFNGLDYADVCRWADESATAVPVIDRARTLTRWSELLADLRAAGVPQAEVARRCGMGPASMSRLALGQQAEPLHSVGEKIIALHIEHCGNKTAR